MREDPGFAADRISSCLSAHYVLAVSSVTYLPIGYDLNAFVYRVEATDGSAYFLKLRRGPMDEIALLVPAALRDRGIARVLAPLPTVSGELWRMFDATGEVTAALYPFLDGENAMLAGMSGAQWRQFGETLAAVHRSGLEHDVADRLPTEAFDLPAAALLEQVCAVAATGPYPSPISNAFAATWAANQGRIDDALARARALGLALRPRTFDLVLCHADIHAANILVGTDGEITLIDWDGPKIAPRERDLLFVAGSRIARTVEMHEEDAFFTGYGPADIDPDALRYYRYERVIEDLGEFGRSVFLTAGMSDDLRRAEVAMAAGLMAPGGDLDWVETLPRLRFPAG